MTRSSSAQPAPTLQPHLDLKAPPPLPEEIVERTRTRYLEAYERLTGHRF